MTGGLDGLVGRHAEQWGRTPDGVWRAPGRVNLIGEHTDYNQGFVLPFAIAEAVHVAASSRSDLVLGVSSRQFGTAEVDLASAVPRSDWLRYPEAALRTLEASGVPVAGIDLTIESTVPVGAGLSSSAALLCAVLLAATDVGGVDLEPEALALLAQRAESEWVGVPVGVMDPIASMCSIEGHALFLDCRSLEYSPVPLAGSPGTDPLSILVIDTRAHRELVTGEYAKRRESCERAAAALGVESLRDATIDMLGTSSLDEVEARRARHVINENQRVVDAVDLMRRHRLEEIGPLLQASHRSLAEDYEVSIPELDVAVEASVEAGALGARMTGAGFGGCAIALVPERALEGVSSAVGAAFAARGFISPSVMRAWPGPGASRVA
ncbi:MAG TPA: galactokinase [Acidimicrobiia bacterium]|nr:galactokinase [Acidimicrobiia bacterium]